MVRFQPHMLRDTDEKWSPINVDRFLAGPGRQCAKEVGCIRVGKMSSGFPNPAVQNDVVGVKPAHIELDKVDGEYQTPHSCTRDRYECAGDQAMYVLASRFGGESPSNYRGLIALQYWWFFRYNGTVKGNHQGDWEGVTVYVDPSRKFSRDVGYLQHGKLVHYFGVDGHLARWNGSSDDDVPGSDPYTRKKAPIVQDNVGKGQRGPYVYTASGRHGSYPVPGHGIDIPTDIHLPGGGAVQGAGENYDGKRGWVRGCRKGQAVCLYLFPTAHRRHLADRPIPGGPWGAYPRSWGSDEGIRGPGFGANESIFRQPFSTLYHDVFRPRAVASPRGEQRSGACDSWFGAGVTALVCGEWPLITGTSLTISGPGRETEVWPAGAIGMGSEWAIQRLGPGLRTGETLRLSTPIRETMTLLLRVSGRDGEPYLFRVHGRDVAGRAALYVEEGPGGVPRLLDDTGREHGKATGGYSFEGGRLAWLTVSGARAALRVAGVGPIAKARLVARLSNERTSGGTIVIGRGHLDGAGYQRWEFRVPRGTRSISGELLIGGQRGRTAIYAESNLQIFEPVPVTDRRLDDNPGVVGEAARPTGSRR